MKNKNPLRPPRLCGKKVFKELKCYRNSNVKEIREALGVRAIGRSIIEEGEQRQLRDAQQPYNGYFDPEKDCLSQNNGLEWNVFPDIYLG
jgi:hypothetical protein